MTKPAHIFFDLDRTLWDFDTNSRSALQDLYEEYSLPFHGIEDFDHFFSLYSAHNDECWELYRNNRMTKKVLRYERFRRTLGEYGVDNYYLVQDLGNDYLRISPQKTALVEGAREVLQYLEGKYVMHIITNGFEEVQLQKLEVTGLTPYFQHLITSERAGRRKPDPQIFSYAMKRSGATPSESLIIGDDLNADVMGARNAGWDAIWFNTRRNNTEEVTYSGCVISDLRELLEIL